MVPSLAAIFTAKQGLLNVVVTGNALGGTVPDAINLLRSATVIDISNNGFTGLLPQSIANLPVLSLTFTVSHNNVMLPAGSVGTTMCNVIDNCASTWIVPSTCSKCAGTETASITPSQTPTHTPTQTQTPTHTPTKAPLYQVSLSVTFNGLTQAEAEDPDVQLSIRTAVAEEGDVAVSAVSIRSIELIAKSGVRIVFSIATTSSAAATTLQSHYTDAAALQTAINAQLAEDDIDVVVTVSELSATAVSTATQTQTPTRTTTQTPTATASVTRSKAHHEDSTSSASSQFVWTSLLLVLGAIFLKM